MRAEDPYLRLERKTRITESGCWEWTGGYKGAAKHGAIKVNGRMEGVHRLSARRWLGLGQNDPRHVLHHCDNPRCWRPSHLYLGTHQDNMRDKRERKRARSGKQKLTPEQVVEIREKIKQGVRNMHLAEEYNISRSMISSIRHHRYWT